MREVIFVKQSNDRWKKFEKLLTDKDTDNPDEISSLYIQLIDDLSYARTYYPDSPTYRYLNELSGRAHQVIYKNKKEKRNRIINFWRTELPLVFYKYQKQFFICFIVFFVSVLIGALSVSADDSFVRLLLGDSYVDKTIENIKHGNPMGIYDSENGLIMYLMIASNNIKVAFTIFAVGIFFSIGSLLLTFYNGLVLGSFLYFFYQYGALKESMLTVWLHGTIEISVCIVAGCAGMAMGNSLMFPGTYTRLQSFRTGAMNGLKIVLGTVPFFLIAAFIESFVTRHERASQLFDVLLILLSLVLIIGYFVIYPIRLNRKVTALTTLQHG
jgi:uncharacterized membrane protein SpoIIM required for sporulation